MEEEEDLQAVFESQIAFIEEKLLTGETSLDSLVSKVVPDDDEELGERRLCELNPSNSIQLLIFFFCVQPSFAI